MRGCIGVGNLVAQGCCQLVRLEEPGKASCARMFVARLLPEPPSVPPWDVLPCAGTRSIVTYSNSRQHTSLGTQVVYMNRHAHVKFVLRQMDMKLPYLGFQPLWVHTWWGGKLLEPMGHLLLD
eukprot:1159540-Pelagomonas_calceolata.AAC.4